MCELFSEPIDILNKIGGAKSEMTEWELSFLCGLIKQKKPKKILEIGVAAGGTTAVILNCLSQLEVDSKVFSIDVNEKLYSDNSKYTGYLTEQCIPYLSEKIERKLYVNGISVEFLDEIGKNIDFLILDTMHILPGEVLDFLACLPYLSEGCTVVLHDIALHHSEGKPNTYATQVLLNVVVGEKLVGQDLKNIAAYPNIGAFTITKDTKKYVENVFSALMITWRYIPEEEQIRLYREFYCKHYDKKFIDLFDAALELNKATYEKVKKNAYNELCEMFRLVNRCSKYNTYIYGCGEFGKKYFELLGSSGVQIGGYIISDGKIKDVNENVFYLSEIDFNEETDLILVGVNTSIHEEIKEELDRYSVKNYILPNAVICDFIGKWENGKR